MLCFSVFILSHKFTQIDCEFVCAVLQMHINFIKPSSIHDPIGMFCCFLFFFKNIRIFEIYR